MITETTQHTADAINNQFRSSNYSASEFTASPWGSPDGSKQRIYFTGSQARGYLDFKNGGWVRVNTYSGSFNANLSAVIGR